MEKMYFNLTPLYPVSCISKKLCNVFLIRKVAEYLYEKILVQMVGHGLSESLGTFSLSSMQRMHSRRGNV